jgi:LPXTG-site transpeptidase (sortase) family protein
MATAAPDGVPRRPVLARALERALAGVGILALAYLSYALTFAGIVGERQGRRLEDLLAGAVKERHGLIGRLEIPRLGVLAVVQEGVEDRTLSWAAGHVTGTALPGQHGNVVVAAHRDTLFRRLEGVRAGDALRFVTPEGNYEYAVTSTEVVAPTRTDVLHPRAPREATLVTCYPFGFVGPAPMRFVVRAASVSP